VDSKLNGRLVMPDAGGNGFFPVQFHKKGLGNAARKCSSWLTHRGLRHSSRAWNGRGMQRDALRVMIMTGPTIKNAARLLLL
jgi:hypothetical protein